MVKVNDDERNLINDLESFKKDSLAIIKNVYIGATLMMEILNLEATKDNPPKICTILKELEEVLEKFYIGSEKDSSNDGTENLWIQLNLSRRYRDSESSPVTEKRVAFVLMSFEREVSTLLSTLECMQKNNFIFFCTTLRARLHKIIEDYMTA